MKRAAGWVIRLHYSLLRLYPKSFWKDFAEELGGVFADMLLDASREGFLAQVKVILREFTELPINVIDEHLGSLWRSGYLMSNIKSAIRAILFPLMRILVRAILIEACLLLVLAHIGHWKDWVDLPGFHIMNPSAANRISDILFYTGNIVLFVAIATFVGVRQYPVYGDRLTQFMRMQKVETEAEWGFGVHGMAPGLAGFLKKYATPLALILDGATTIFLAIRIS